jgi:hypothetical protein
MPLSRLENFLKNAEGNILYVNPSDFDATDSFENQGNSLTRPFKTIQRALIEAARFSYQQGRNNDRIDRTTILVYPGTHYIDNRPGLSVEDINGSAVYKKRVSPLDWVPTTIDQFSNSTNYDILDTFNDLYKFNSIHGGAILPRGTSIIGLDLRKTKIRPLYVPDPLDDNVENSSILNVTGTCYFTAFSIFDGDPSRTVFKNYTDTRVTPNFSHHKLVTFAYADGVNKVKLGNYQTYLTDLDMYYYKVAKAYGDISGRGLIDYPASDDFEPNVDEFRIVGSLDANPLGISSIRAGNGDGTGDLNLITITTASKLTGDVVPHNLFIDSPFILNGVTVDGASYNGSYTVKDVVGINTFTYITPQQPQEFLPNTDTFDTATLTVGSDTVSSASPYVFNCSLRSVYGMNGLWADGSKASGFKSIVVAQFTGVSLQKDDNAFMVYEDGAFYDNATLPENSPQRPLHTNSRARYKPDWENFHIRASNDSFIQNVSVFAIGFAKHFLTETGGDMSITNSNSNFGSVSLESVSYKSESFDRDDVGYITHIIPPKEIPNEENVVSWLSLDVSKTINSADPEKLYIYAADNEELLPSYQVDGFRIGAKDNDRLYLTISVGAAQTTYSSPIYMPVSGGSGVSSRKEYKVRRIGSTNDIVNNVITFETPHQLIVGERVRIFSDTAECPTNLTNEGVYYVITEGLGANQIKLAQSLNDALSNNALLGLGNNGGVLSIVSRVTDKIPGEIGHPIQYDSQQRNWYITGPKILTATDIRSALISVGINAIGTETPAAYFTRKPDNRSINDKIYKIRYVIPKEYTNARQPEAGFILQESKTVGVSSVSFTNDTLKDTKDLRNEKVIVNATAGSVINNQQLVTITTELPHNFMVGDTIKLQKIRSENNPDSTGIVSTYNGNYEIANIINNKQFTYIISGVSTNPGTFSNDINARATRQQRESLPVVSRKDYKNTFVIYRVSQVKKHIPGEEGQDGIYHLIAIASNVSPPPQVGFNLSSKEFNQDIKNLYPQLDRDNTNSDPQASTSFADLEILGSVITDKKTNSITKEALNYFLKNTNVGLAITSVSLSGVGNTIITINTQVQHQLNPIKTVSFTGGSGYPTSQELYSKELLSLVSSGEGATARVTTNSSGSIANIQLLDNGSSYSSGDTLSISGGTVPSTVTITSINNYVGSTIELNGFSNPELNSAFEVLSIPNSKTIVLGAPLGITTYSPNTDNNLPFAVKSHFSVNLNSIALTDISSGIATISCLVSHGLYPGNKIRIVNSGVIDGDHVVRDVVGLTTFTLEIKSDSEISGSTGKVLKRTISSNGRNIGSGEENLQSRGTYFYDGFATTLNLALDPTNTTISVADPSGIRRGDYLTINSEVVRVMTSSNPFTVRRGVFGTFKTTGLVGTSVKKIKVLPTEIRRPSYMRASGHTFEYLGYGPGNYSTGMPQKQDRVLSETEIIVSQSREQRGGTVVYTGMNDLGETFTGSKKVSAATGEETIYDAPILTYSGDDAEGQGETVSNGIFDEILVRQRITVEGGESNNQTSQFYGPVNFTQKVTNLSNFGIESKYLLLKGEAPQSKTITVGISTPTSSLIPSPRAGDMSFISNPTGGYLGHVRVNNEWRKFGLVSLNETELGFSVDRFFVNTDPDNSFDFAVGGSTRVEDIIVSGNIVFQQPQTLGNVTFENTFINGTATYLGISKDPITGLTTNYTQIHLAGISLLNDLEVSGISTFSQKVDFLSNVFGIGAKFGNIRIAIADDNTIDTTSGDLTINSNSGIVKIIDDLDVTGSRIKLSSVSGFVTSILENSRDLTLGIGVTWVNSGSTINLHNDSKAYPDGGLRIIRNAGIGTQSAESQILHRGGTKLKINAVDHGSSISLMTDNKERVLVGASGTVTVFQNNSGQNLAGGHLRLTQAGSGDVALSWDITNQNKNVRWYAGIDASDGNSWKLANPLTTVAYGQENFATASETKLRVSTTGDVTIQKDLILNGTTISTPTTTTFTLLDTNIETLDAFRSAKTITMGSAADESVFVIQGVTQSSSTITGSFQTRGGVGISKNLYVGGNANITGSSSIGDTLTVAKTTTINENVESTSKSTGSLIVVGGAGIGGNIYGGKNLNITSNGSIGGTLGVTGATTLSSTLYVGSTSQFVGAATFDTGLVPDADEGAYIGTAALPFSEAHIGEIRIANGTADNTIDTATGNLTLDSNGGTVAVSDNLSVSEGTTLSKTLSVGGVASFTDTTQSTACTNGAVVISGGLGVQKDIYTCGKIYGPNGEIGQVAEQVKTVATSANANHFITFVDSNNSEATAESVYTDGGIYYNPSSNNFFVTGDITAFASDDRLKENVTKIENALDKVISLDGFIYNFNEVGGSLGFDTETKHVGVSAQQVQKVLPEAVAAAPANEEYLTVKYEKLVPLLIEAIKELKQEIEELKRK